MKNTYKHSPRAQVFKKLYNDICLTVIIELPQGRYDDAIINVLKDEIYNLMHDTELEKILSGDDAQ